MTTTEVRSEGTIYIFFVQKMYYTPSHYKKRVKLSFFIQNNVFVAPLCIIQWCQRALLLATTYSENIYIFVPSSLVEFPQTQKASARTLKTSDSFPSVSHCIDTNRVLEVCASKIMSTELCQNIQEVTIPRATSTSLLQHASSMQSLFQEVTLIIIIFRVRCLVIFLIEAIQVRDLLKQLKNAVSVILEVRNLTVEQVKALQVFEILLKINEKGFFPPLFIDAELQVTVRSQPKYS